MSWFDDVAVRFLTRRRPGRMLTVLAGTRIPIVTPGRFADQHPDGQHDGESPSPLVDATVAPRTGTGTLLEGDVVIKDQIDVAGMRTGVGTADGGEVATKDADVVERILAAGGRIVGKTKMTELGMDGIGGLMHYPMPRNPRAPGYVPGGSSTGTAVAIAAGLARYGVGGDGLGSIRIPAAFCGLYGLKPTRTKLPRGGIQSPVRTLDAIGPMTRTAADCARLWQVMVGEPVADLSAWMPARVGVPVFAEPLRVAPSVGAAFIRVLTSLGVAIEQVELPGLERATFLGGMTGAHELATGSFASRTTTRAGQMSLALGRSFSPHHFARLEKQRADLRSATLRLLEHMPILAMPTTAIPPPAMSRALIEGGANVLLLRALGAFTPLANLVDLPAIAVPCGVDDRGRPLSIMFVAAPGCETELLRIAHAVEATGLATQPL